MTIWALTLARSSNRETSTFHSKQSPKNSPIVSIGRIVPHRSTARRGARQPRRGGRWVVRWPAPLGEHHPVRIDDARLSRMAITGWNDEPAQTCRQSRGRDGLSAGGTTMTTSAVGVARSDREAAAARREPDLRVVHRAHDHHLALHRVLPGRRPSAPGRTILTSSDTLVCLLFLWDFLRSYRRAPVKRAYMFGDAPDRRCHTACSTCLAASRGHRHPAVLRIFRVARLTRLVRASGSRGLARNSSSAAPSRRST